MAGELFQTKLNRNQDFCKCKYSWIMELWMDTKLELQGQAEAGKKDKDQMSKQTGQA